MKFSCSRDSLLYAVSVAQRAVPSTSSMPILECLLIEAYEEVKITGNNLELGIEYRLEASVDSPGAIAVNSKRFGDIIRKLSDDTVHIATDDNNMVMIKCGHAVFDILGVPVSDFPALPNVEAVKSVTVKEGIFKDIIRQTIFSISVNEVKPILTGSYVEVNDSTITVVSCDGYRLAIRNDKIERSSDNFSFVVPGKTLREIFSILKGTYDDITVNLTDKHMLIKFDECIMVSRLLEGEYINYKQIIPKDHTLLVNVDTASFTSSIERAGAVISENAKSPVVLDITDGSINISCVTPNGDFKDIVDAETDGENIEIGFNHKYLLDALKGTEDETISIEFTTELSPCLIKSTESDKYMFIILPVRLKK